MNNTPEKPDDAAKNGDSRSQQRPCSAALREEAIRLKNHALRLELIADAVEHIGGEADAYLFQLLTGELAVKIPLPPNKD